MEYEELKQKVITLASDLSIDDTEKAIQLSQLIGDNMRDLRQATTLAVYSAAYIGWAKEFKPFLKDEVYNETCKSLDKIIDKMEADGSTAQEQIQWLAQYILDSWGMKSEMISVGLAKLGAKIGSMKISGQLSLDRPPKEVLQTDALSDMFNEFYKKSLKN